MDTFSYTCDAAPKGKHKPRALTLSLGDGYRQDMGDGINTDLPSWSLSFSVRDLTEFQAIRSFLASHPCWVRFLWMPPGGSQGTYICEEWDEAPYTNGVSTHAITATFQQVVA